MYCVSQPKLKILRLDSKRVSGCYSFVVDWFYAFIADKMNVSDWN